MTIRTTLLDRNVIKTHFLHAETSVILHVADVVPALGVSASLVLPDIRRILNKIVNNFS